MSFEEDQNLLFSQGFDELNDNLFQQSFISHAPLSHLQNNILDGRSKTKQQKLIFDYHQLNGTFDALKKSWDSDINQERQQNSNYFKQLFKFNDNGAGMEKNFDDKELIQKEKDRVSIIELEDSDEDNGGCNKNKNNKNNNNSYNERVHKDYYGDNDDLRDYNDQYDDNLSQRAIIQKPKSIVSISDSDDDDDIQDVQDAENKQVQALMKKGRIKSIRRNNIQIIQGNTLNQKKQKTKPKKRGHPIKTKKNLIKFDESDRDWEYSQTDSESKNNQ